MALPESNSLSSSLQKVSLKQEDDPIEEKTDTTPAVDMDKLLEISFLNAVYNAPADIDLPITSSVFYSDHVLKSRPDETLIELKQTSFKKASKFFKAMEKAGFISTRDRKGELVITKLNLERVTNSGFIPYTKRKCKIAESAELVENPSSGAKVRISAELVYKPTNQFRIVMEEVAADKALLAGSGTMLTHGQVKKMVVDYVKLHQLVLQEDKRSVHL